MINSFCRMNPLGLVGRVKIVMRSLFTGSANYRMGSPSVRLDIEVDRIVWMDMEMTGLDIEKDKIMEVACLVTDSDLNIVAEGPDLIINQPTDILDNMNEWCKIQHGLTGLTSSCQKSSLTIEEAETRILHFLKDHIMEKASPLAGNSVYMDRLFLRKFMANVDNFLHYRIIDVSTIKEVCRRWNSDLYKLAPKKDYNHRAMNDIKESIEELKFYKENFFRTANEKFSYVKN